jgi:hypothetical protein
MTAGGTYYFNRATYSTPSSDEFKLCKFDEAACQTPQPKDNDARIQLSDKGTNSCPEGSVDFTEDECRHLGKLSYSFLRSGYGLSEWPQPGQKNYAGQLGEWSGYAFSSEIDLTGCTTAGKNYNFNRATSYNPRGNPSTWVTNSWKLCKTI